MAKGQRSHKRSQEILDYILAHYPEEGPDAVAEALGEPVAYIINKANHHKINYKHAVIGRPKGSTLENAEIMRLQILCHKHEEKIKDQLGQLDRVKADYNKEHSRNKELREELILNIAHIRMYKKKLGLID